MAIRSSNYWMDFFLDSNLPQSVATKYAVIFTDHRIQENMLGDITKDMLYDMGIKTMGDVIAILKHAKEVNDEKIQHQLLGKSNFSVPTNKPKVQVSSINKEPISGQNVSSSTSGSIVKTAKRNTISSEDIQGPMKVRRVINSVATSRILPNINSRGSSSTTPIQAKVTFNSSPNMKSSSLRLGSTHQDSVTRKVSVFTRLGDNEVSTPASSSSSSSLSSSINKLKVTSREPKVTRTITGLDGGPSTVKYSQSKSVKDRLGGSKMIRGSNSTRPVINSNVNPRQASPNQQSRNKISLKKSIFDRLGTKSF